MGEFEPYVPARTTLPELTSRALILGVILGALMTAANTYFGFIHRDDCISFYSSSGYVNAIIEDGAF